MANEQRVVGATIAGKYRVRRIVGAGSMGFVCEAEHLDIGKRVAIKLIDASLAGMKDIAMRFRQEARAASLIESQHIVQVFDVGEDGELGLYLVMEYLVGEDLAKVLAREKRLSADTAVRIAIQVARGLAKAHEAGVVHRDLKPANIFLCASDDDQPHAKILDFGISKLIESSRARLGPGLKLTRDGMVVGTPQYMSPEQAQGYVVDKRTDVWALGLVLYEMLAGRPAYLELPSYERFIIHLVSEPPDPLRRVAPWVSEELGSVVHAALAHDLNRRIASCGELVKRLTEAHAAGSGPARPRAPQGVNPRALEASDTLVMAGRPSRAPPAKGAGATGTQEMPVAGDEPPPPASSLAASGVRGSERPTALAEDLEHDAPEFFDRRRLKNFVPVDPPFAAAARPDPVAPVAQGTGARRSVRQTAAVERGRSGSFSLSRVAWAGLLFLVLGLLVVAAFVRR